MITSIACYITDFLFSREIIDETDKEIYLYGFEILFASMLNIIMIVLVGLLFGQFLSGICFFVSFSILRKFCGGYHADTYLVCNLVFAINVFIVMLMLKMKIYLSEEMLAGILLVCLGIITLYAPVRNKNKELSDDDIKKYRSLSIVVGIFITIISMGIRRLNTQISAAINWALVSVAIAMLVEICRERRSKYGKES